MNENLILIGLVFLVIVLYLASYKQREDFSSLKRRVMGYDNLNDNSMEDAIVPSNHKKIAVKIGKQVLSTINKRTNQSYQLTNFDQIVVDENVSIGGKPATRYTLDMFTVQPGSGVGHDVTKRILLVFTVIEGDNPDKAGNTGVEGKRELKVQVESISTGNSKPYPNKYFFDETDNEQDNLIITDNLIKPNNDVPVTSFADTTIPFSIYKHCGKSSDSKKNGGPVDCEKQYSFQQTIFPAQIQEKHENMGIKTVMQFNNAREKYEHYQKLNNSNNCMKIPNEFSVLGSDREDNTYSQIFDKSNAMNLPMYGVSF
jgi:hypothetical protein